jgi:hypothetical protein
LEPPGHELGAQTVVDLVVLVDLLVDEGDVLGGGRLDLFDDVDGRAADAALASPARRARRGRTPRVSCTASTAATGCGRLVVRTRDRSGRPPRLAPDAARRPRRPLDPPTAARHHFRILRDSERLACGPSDARFGLP